MSSFVGSVNNVLATKPASRHRCRADNLPFLRIRTNQRHCSTKSRIFLTGAPLAENQIHQTASGLRFRELGDTALDLATHCGQDFSFDHVLFGCHLFDRLGHFCI